MQMIAITLFTFEVFHSEREEQPEKHIQEMALTALFIPPQVAGAAAPAVQDDFICPLSFINDFFIEEFQASQIIKSEKIRNTSAAARVISDPGQGAYAPFFFSGDPALG